MWMIRNLQTGKTIEIVRDAAHDHPGWVLDQVGAANEGQVQDLLDQLNSDDYVGRGEDSCGISYRPDPIEE
jgi:hypothetical protein